MKKWLLFLIVSSAFAQNPPIGWYARALGGSGGSGSTCDTTTTPGCASKAQVKQIVHDSLTSGRSIPKFSSLNWGPFGLIYGSLDSSGGVTWGSGQGHLYNNGDVDFTGDLINRFPKDLAGLPTNSGTDANMLYPLQASASDTTKYRITGAQVQSFVLGGLSGANGITVASNVIKIDSTQNAAVKFKSINSDTIRSNASDASILFTTNPNGTTAGHLVINSYLAHTGIPNAAFVKTGSLGVFQAGTQLPLTALDTTGSIHVAGANIKGGDKFAGPDTFSNVAASTPVLATNAAKVLIAGTTTGTGSTVVLNNGPTLIAPVLGTPASGVMTNVTGLPIGAITGGTNHNVVTYGASAPGTGIAPGTSGNVLKSDGTNWTSGSAPAPANTFANGLTTATTGNGAIDSMSLQGANIASATTTTICTATGLVDTITGTTTITSFGACRAGVERDLIFKAALTLTYNSASLLLPGAANITTAANDVAHCISTGGSNWVCSYTRASGQGFYTGTANQVVITGNVLSLPQSVNTAATPTFSSLTLSGQFAMDNEYSGAGGNAIWVFGNNSASSSRDAIFNMWSNGSNRNYINYGNSSGTLAWGAGMNLVDTSYAVSYQTTQYARPGTSDMLKISKAGNATFGGSLTTAAPSGGSGAGAWKLGTRVTRTCTPSTTVSVEVDIGGTLMELVTCP